MCYLSVIIAMYNTDKYIEKCIRSLYAEGAFSNDLFEVLVVNDGSIDNSRQIVEQLQTEYPNLYLFNKENGGLGSARNMALEKAKGKYFCFVDSDDFVNSCELKKIFDFLIQNDLDILPTYFTMLNGEYERIERPKDDYDIIDSPITGGEFMVKYPLGAASCQNFFKLSIIRETGLRFTEGIYHEDEEFTSKFLSYSKRTAYQRHLWYNYVFRDNSIVNKKDSEHRKKLRNDIRYIALSLLKHRENFRNDSLEFKGLSKKIEQLQISLFVRMKTDGLVFKDVKEEIRIMRELSLFPVKIKYQSLKFKLSAIFFNSSFFRRIFYK